MNPLKSQARLSSLTPSRRLLAILVAAFSCLSCSTVPRVHSGSPTTGVGFAGPHRGLPSHFNQSCGAACAAPVVPSTGEILAPAATRAGQVLEKVVQAAETLHGLLTVSRFLDEAQKTKVEDILTR